MKPKILLIDDESGIRTLYRNFLEMENYDIYEAENGQQAFKMASETYFDLYVTDIMMPETNGVDFMKILKMIDPDAVVILITGFDDMEYTKQAIDYGAFRFLTKPINMKEFLSIVKRGVEERIKLLNSSGKEKIRRIKDKLDSNSEFKKKIFDKFENFLMEIEKLKISYLEIGGRGSDGNIWFKHHNKFVKRDDVKKFKQDEIDIMTINILTDNQINILLEERCFRFNYFLKNDYGNHQYHINIFYDCKKLVMGIKLIRDFVIPVENQRIPSVLLDKISCKKEGSGLVVFSGSKGMGKSSLIDSVIEYNNRHVNGSVYIIGNLIECFHASQKCIIRHQEINEDVNSVREALEECYYASPNLVVIEDIVNYDILDAVLHLVDSGSMVYATLRNKSVTSVLHRLLNMAPGSERERIRLHLADNLRAVVVQKLINSTEEDIIPVREALVNNSKVRNIISNNKLNEIYNVMLQGKYEGMFTLEQDLANLARNKKIKIEDALEHANNEEQIKFICESR